MTPIVGARRRSGWQVALCLGAISVVVVACGSGSGPGGSGPPSSGPPGTYKPTGDASSAQVYTAHYLNLTSKDLPGSWTDEHHGTGPNVVRSSLDDCVAQALGGMPPVTTAVSPNFLDLSNGREIGSQVQVYKTAAGATAAGSSAGSSSVGTCLSSTVQADLPKTLTKGEKLSRVTVTGSGVPGTTRGEFSQRVGTVITYPLSGGKTGGTSVYIDVVGFARGDALVEVEFESSGSLPPETLERATLAPLKHRAGIA